jgi:hypothetical protein
MARAPSGVATLSRLATASPPSALISLTRASAGPSSVASPDMLTPGSLTTIFAPRDASSSA